MGNLIFAAILLAYLPAELLSIQVVVPQSERSTTLFASVTILCDYSTSANPSDVLLTWKFKSFCKDPVLEYYTTGYQAALHLGQDPTNDCPDSQRIIRTVIQKKGTNEPILGSEYTQRKITIRNKADLVISEIMWWDNGVYFCTVDATGDTTGDSDQEVKLIVYNWLTVLFIIMGGLLLIMLFCICCCQCCPHKCCCYVRCPCCPETCCCPEKAVMQHRMMKEVSKAMAPWMHGQPIYAPAYSGGSSQGKPLLYSGSFSDHPSKQNFAMAPMALHQQQQQQKQQPPPPHHGYYGNGHNQVLDFLENQVRGLDAGAPPVPPHGATQYAPPMQQAAPQHHRAPQAVPYTPGPPSMLSALGEMGVRGTERRVITLPPIVQRVPSVSLRRGGGGEEDDGGVRVGHRTSRQSSGSSIRAGGGRGGRHRDDRAYRASSLPRRSILRGNSDDSDWENRGRAAGEDRGRPSGRREGRSKPRSYSRDDLKEELRRSLGLGDVSSDEDDSWRAKGGKAKDWPEKPPSYSSIENQSGRHSNRRNYDPLSDRSSHSATSVVI